MNAHEWETTADVDAMLTAVKGRVSDRKLVLFACGCCRLAEGAIPGMTILAGKFESGADRPFGREERASIFSAIFQMAMGDLKPLMGLVLGGGEQSPWFMATRGASLLRQLAARQPGSEAGPNREPIMLVGDSDPHSPEQAAVLREVLGNPFRPLAFDPHWRTETVLGLATAIDEGQAWDRMPILADALQDAGCEAPEILAHCRDAGQAHRRGCWVIDEILGRP